MSESAPTLSFIQSLLSPLRYGDKQRVATDVLGLIKNTNSLQIKIGPFVHANGVTDTLLSLTGTIPIDYKGGTYNIPVTLWLGESYPMRPPSCYVTPTRDMRIKDGHLHVDHFGVVYLPYLNQWTPHTSTLIEMVTIMSSVFSQDPPVFKVPSAAAQMPQPSAQQQAAFGQQQQQQQPYGAQAAQGRLPSGQQYVNPYAQSPHSQPNIMQPPQQPVMQPRYNSGDQQQQQQQANQSPAHAGGMPPSPHSAGVSPPEDTRAMRKNQLLAQLTLKLRQYLTDELSAKSLLIDDLKQSQQQVEAHAAAIATEKAALQEQLARVREAQASVAAHNEELAKWLQQQEKREMPHVDQLCYPKDTWSKQLLDAVALDSALEDAFYVLDRALQDERIDLQSYTKQIRALARKQFLARCLVKQIQAQQQMQAAPAHQPSAQQQAQQQPQHVEQPAGGISYQPPRPSYQPPVHRPAQLGDEEFVMLY